MLFKIRFGNGTGHGSIPRRTLAQKEHSNRFADDQASAQHYDSFAFRFDAFSTDQLDDWQAYRKQSIPILLTGLQVVALSHRRFLGET